MAVPLRCGQHELLAVEVYFQRDDVPRLWRVHLRPSNSATSPACLQMLYVLVARSSFQKETNTVAFANQPGNLVLHLDRQMPHGLHAFVRELIALGRGRVLHSCFEYINEPHADQRALQCSARHTLRAVVDSTDSAL